MAVLPTGTLADRAMVLLAAGLMQLAGCGFLPVECGDELLHNFAIVPPPGVGIHGDKHLS